MSRFFYGSFLGLTLFLVPMMGLAQEAPPPVAPARPKFYSMAEALKQLEYEPEESGPLLIVVGSPVFSPRETRSLRWFADAFQRKMMAAGAITVLAPKQMMIIAAEPGKAKTFAGLESSERMKLFLASLDESQWIKAGGAGIGMGDLSPEQQEMFASFLPPRMAVYKQTTEAVEGNPSAIRYSDPEGPPTPLDIAQMKLVIGRRTTYEFRQVGKEDSHARSNSGGFAKPGKTIYNLTSLPDTAGKANEAATGMRQQQEKDRRSAYGNVIVRTVPSALKRGDINYSAPALNVTVALSPDKLTIGGALKAVNAATGLALQADRRIQDYPIYLKTLPNQSLRAGDVLEALAWAVTGTYRRLDGTVYVLTDDVEGIGTRFARLSAWAAAASQARYDQLEKTTRTMARNNPIVHIRSFLGEGVSQPANMVERMEKAWGKEKYAMSVEYKADELPPDIRKDMETQAEYWNERSNPPIPVHTDKVGVGIDIAFAWKMPDGNTVQVFEAQDGYGLGGQFLGQITAPDPTAKKEQPTTPVPYAPEKRKNLPALPANLKRRSLIINPTTPEEARQLTLTGVARGMSEIWVMKTLDAGDDAPLKTVIAAAKAYKIPAYIAVSMVRFAKIGQAERNILGQTGDEFATAYLNGPPFDTHPDWRSSSEWQLDRWRKWFYPAWNDIPAMEKRLLTLAAIPGVAGIAFKNTAAPGYAGQFVGGDGIWQNGFFGYTLPMRLAFLREKGIDPIDIVEADYGMRDLDYSLPFFPSSGGYIGQRLGANDKMVEVEIPEKDWRDYRAERSAGWLKRFHRALRTAKPNLPLYISDRASDYATPYAEWFGLWEDADAIPQNPVFAPEGTGRAQAHQLHKIVLKRSGWDKASGAKGETEWFADAIVGKAKEAAQGYDGLVIDLSQLSAKDALRLLGGLGETTPVKVTER